MKSMRWNVMAPLSIAVLIFLLAGTSPVRLQNLWD